MLERIVHTIARHNMFQTGQRVGVAVSGGADSVCLLHILFELAPRWNLHLSVLHLDHQLRGEESREDAGFARALAEKFSLPFHLGETDVRRAVCESGDNLEQAARNARQQFFLDHLRTGSADCIATGHTSSDQAETVLFRFLRGSGTAGLAGIRPVTAKGLVRPLIEIEGEEIEQYLREHHIAWREDSTNASRDFARNRIRHDVLPMLEREWNPAMRETLAHTADWALEEEAYWQAETDRLASELLTLKPPALFVRTDQLNGLPVAAARRLVRRALEQVKGDLLAIDFRHIQAILALASQAEGDGRLQVPGVDVYRSFRWMRMAPPGMDRLENRNYRFPVPVPGSVPVPGGSSALVFQVIENRETTRFFPDSGYNKWMDHLDWARISGSLELRNWRPGDQYQPVGHSGEEKIKLLFQQARVPLWERRNWPVIISGSEILWARRFGPAANVAATPDTRVILTIQETENCETWNQS